MAQQHQVYQIQALQRKLQEKDLETHEIVKLLKRRVDKERSMRMVLLGVEVDRLTTKLADRERLIQEQEQEIDLLR